MNNQSYNLNTLGSDISQTQQERPKKSKTPTNEMNSPQYKGNNT
jgi:hypothetical protein